MKKIIYGTFFVLYVLISSAFIRIITVESGTNDCMIEYVMSDKNSGYMYKIGDNMYHIDTESYPGLEQVGVSNGCLMVPYSKKYTFMALSNTLYCGVVSFIAG